MDSQEYIDQYEQSLHDLLFTHLLRKEKVDILLPDAPDMNERWENICQAYLPDGVREFSDYPSVSLGWIMYVGMALAQLWDDDWERYSSIDTLYQNMRDARGYDLLDEYISEDILHLSTEGCTTLATLVSEIANMALHALQHEDFEPSTPLAFHAYIRTLHQMYIFGVAIQLKQLGYHMEKM